MGLSWIRAKRSGLMLEMPQTDEKLSGSDVLQACGLNGDVLVI